MPYIQCGRNDSEQEDNQKSVNTPLACRHNRPPRNRYMHVQNPVGIDRQCVNNAAIGVDDGGNAIVGRAQQRQSVFHRANLSLPEMLIGTWRVAEPGIVGDVYNKPG